MSVLYDFRYEEVGYYEVVLYFYENLYFYKDPNKQF